MSDIYRAFVIRKENEKYILDIINPYEALYSSVFGVQCDTLTYTQDGMCRRMFDELIGKLDSEERAVISGLYGYCSERCTVSDLAGQLGIDEAKVDSLHNRALEKLRAPENYIYLEKKWYSGNDIVNPEYELDYKGKIKSELMRYLSGHMADNVYMDAIMKRYRIDIRRQHGESDWGNRLENPGESKFDTELSVIHPMDAGFSGKKHVDDALKTLKALKITAGPENNIRKRRNRRGLVDTVIISQDGVEQAYKYSGLSDDDIAECVYQVIAGDADGYGCILDYNISDGLMGLLLLKGYLYMKSLVEDRVQIYSELLSSGFGVQAEEFKKFVDKAEVYIEDSRHSPVTFVVIPRGAARHIYEDNPVDYHELLASVEAADRELAVLLVRNIKKELAGFDGIECTDAVKKIMAS